MTYITTMLPVLLPIALFVVTLIIIFTIRANDNKNRSLRNVKIMLENHQAIVEASDNNFKQYASELEQSIAKKDAEVKDLIHTVNSQLGELKSYSEDLARLKSAMETYREALNGLARLTYDADDKIETVKNEVEKLSSVRNVIDNFMQDMRDADEHLRNHEARVIQLERESIGRMNNAVSETDSSMDEAMAGLYRESEEIFEDFKAKTDKDTELRLRKIDEAFQAVIHTVQEFFGELESKIEEARLLSSNLPQMPSYEVEKEKPTVIEETEAFKAPRFIPKEDTASIDVNEEVENDIKMSEEDDFAAFGGLVEETSIDIMDMDYSEPHEEEPKNQWETYGEEEVISFDET